jgi:Stealth protein CR4, conserved region 4
LSNLYGDWCLSQGWGEIRFNQCEYRFSCELEADPHAAASLQAALGHKLSICINDTSDNRPDASDIQRRYADILGTLFSQPSAFEQCA